MRLRDIIGLILALILAIGVAFLTRIFLSKEDKPKHETPVQQAEISKILVAGKDLTEGDKINPGDLVWQDWPPQALNVNYIKEGTVKVEDFLGSIVRSHIDKGEPVIASDLVKAGDKGILAAMLSPGMRAVSIDVTPQSASSGLIAPGDYVDVILSKVISPASGNQYGQSRTVLRNVKVLAIDIKMAESHEKPKEAPRIVTLEVTPAQAELVTAAVKEGTLSLSLHSLENISVNNRVDAGEGPPKEKTIILMRGKEKIEIQVPEK